MRFWPFAQATATRPTTIPAVPRVKSQVQSIEAAKWDRIAGTDGAAIGGMVGRTSKSGKRVTAETAMELSAVWACVRQTAQTIASLPVSGFAKGADGGRSEFGNRAIEVLTQTPNANQTALEFWEGQVAWMLTNGNCYSEITRTGGNLTSLEPLPAILVEPVLSDDGRLTYCYHDRGQKEELPADKVFHCKGFGYGGLKGLSAIRYGVQSLGAGLAADEVASRVFANGMNPSGFLSMDSSLTPEQRDRLQEIMGDYVASENAGKVMVLESGMSWSSAMLNPEDAQLLETRRFAIEDICRWFGVPPIVIGHSSDGQTMWGSGVEQILMSWLSQGLNPMLRRMESRMSKTFRRDLGAGVYVEWNREGILQMDSKSKAEFLRHMVNAGIMTPNESRKKLNLPPVTGGDTLLVQGAMVSLDSLMSATGSDA